MEFDRVLKEYSRQADELVCSYLPEAAGYQKSLIEASRYAVEDGGKRLRPVMMRAAYELVKGKTEQSELEEQDRAVVGPFMAALEMIHSFSLVHDDLPCMDNDVLRRGKPSTWAKFGEDMGTLAGDALSIYAFETALKSTAQPDLKLKALEVLASKSGIYGMIGGQSVDVELTGTAPAKEQMLYIYENKTGALLQAALMIGAILAGADSKQTEAMAEAGLAIGMAFQIRDDILDVTATQEELGKPIGSDQDTGKITWLTDRGMQQSEEDILRFTDQAKGAVRALGGHAFLEQLFGWLVSRKK